MSIRRFALASAGLLAAGTIAGVGLSTAGAAGNGGLPFITGGGHTQNFNSDGSPEDGPFLTTFGGFNARATAAGEDAGEYVADGEVQGRSSDDATHQTVGKVHGDVVCIANLGPAEAEDGGVAGSDVWEIRFRVERSDPALPAPAYGSLIVQDNGPHNDFADESFEGSLITDPECGDVTQFQLEPHQGQITVHNG
jgi:hypothetical protein